MKKIIKEDISKSTNAALVYHRTKSIDNIKEITINGFDPGDGAYYGKGFYSTYNEKSMNNTKQYGNIILKCIVTNLRGNFLIFDKVEAQKIYGENCQLEEQIPNLPQDCIDYLLTLKVDFNKYNRLLTKNIKIFTDKFNNLLGNQIAGISYSGGAMDFDVIVVYKCKKTDGFLNIIGYKIDGISDFTKIRYEDFNEPNLSNEEIISKFNEAIKKNPDFIDDLKNFKDILSSNYIITKFNEVIEKNPYLFKYLKNFKDIFSSDYIISKINQAIEKDVHFISYLRFFKDILSNDYIISKFNQAIEKDHFIIEYLYAFKDILSSEYIITKFNEAIKKNSYLTQYLKDYKDILSKKYIVNKFNQAIKKEPDIIEYLDGFKDILSSNYIVTKFNQIIEKRPYLVKYLINFKDILSSDEIINIWNIAIKKDPNIIFYLDGYGFTDVLSNEEINKLKLLANNIKNKINENKLLEKYIRSKVIKLLKEQTIYL